MTDVDFEEHPYPEHPAWHIAPLLAAALTVGVLGVVLAVPPSTPRTMAIVVLVLLQLALMAPRGWRHRREGRQPDAAFRVHQFLFLWAWCTGVMTVLGVGWSAVTGVVGGLILAAFMVVGSTFSENRGRRRQNRAPTT